MAYWHSYFFASDSFTILDLQLQLQYYNIISLVVELVVY